MRLNLIIFVSLVCLFGLLTSYFFGATGFYKLSKLEKEEAELFLKVGTLEAKNRMLTDKISSFIKDYEAVEHEAREKLGFIKKDEVFFYNDSLRIDYLKNEK